MIQTANQTSVSDCSATSVVPPVRELRRFDTAEARSFQHVFRHAEEGIELHWYARNHRKRRSHPLKTADGAKVARAPYRLMAVQWRSLSWWVAAVFTVGSLVWLINGLVTVLPFSDEPVVKADVPIWTAVLGGGIFLIGAYLSWLEVFWTLDKVSYQLAKIVRSHTVGVDKSSAEESER